MAESSIADALIDHFNRAWDMIVEAVGCFPDSEWHQAHEERMVPVRIAYHVLLDTERYTWTCDPDDYLAGRKFNLNWEQTPVEDLPTRDECVEHLESMKVRTVDWLRQLGDEGLTTSPPTWPWTGARAVGQALYQLRHLQHHIADLNVELRRRNLPMVAWK